MDLALHFEHLLEACLQRGQHPLDLFFAKLAENLLQLGFGLLQLADCLFLLLGRWLALGLFQLLPGFAHPLLGRFDPRSGRVLRLAVLVVWSLRAVVGLLGLLRSTRRLLLLPRTVRLFAWLGFTRGLLGFLGVG